jgi:hypothetical protein
LEIRLKGDLMKTMTIHQTSGVVQYPHLHDSRLLCIEFDRPTVRLRVLAANGDTLVITLQEVVGMCINSVFEDNIIFEARVLPVDFGHLDEICTALHTTDQNIVSDAIHRLRDTHHLFQVDSTLGADFTVICRRVLWDHK